MFPVLSCPAGKYSKSCLFLFAFMHTSSFQITNTCTSVNTSTVPIAKPATTSAEEEEEEEVGFAFERLEYLLLVEDAVVETKMNETTSRLA